MSKKPSSGVAPANQTKERSVHELFARAFRNKSSICEFRACFPEEKHQNSHKNGRNSYELFVLALSLVWFAGATPDFNWQFATVPLTALIVGVRVELRQKYGTAARASYSLGGHFGSENVFVGYRTIIARYVAKWGIAHTCLCKIKYARGVLHHSGGMLTSLKKYRAIWGIAAIVSQYRAIWGHKATTPSQPRRAPPHLPSLGNPPPFYFPTKVPPPFRLELLLPFPAPETEEKLKNIRNVRQVASIFPGNHMHQKGRKKLKKRPSSQCRYEDLISQTIDYMRVTH